jgi:hypothetical protein
LPSEPGLVIDDDFRGINEHRIAVVANIEAFAENSPPLDCLGANVECVGQRGR